MVCAGGRTAPTARPRTLRLEGRSQAKLDQAWKIVLASYLTKVGTGTTASIRRSELRVIESIEELPPELRPEALIDWNAFECGEVEPMVAWPDRRSRTSAQNSETSLRYASGW